MVITAFGRMKYVEISIVKIIEDLHSNIVKILIQIVQLEKMGIVLKC